MKKQTTIMERINTEHIDHWLESARHCNYRADKLAVREGISQRQLERYTQVLFALSPHAWLTMERMIFAKELLMKLGSVKDVAFALEYKRVSHFSREFKVCYELLRFDGYWLREKNERSL
jgi:AraC-like DNA-binding protein